MLQAQADDACVVEILQPNDDHREKKNEDRECGNHKVLAHVVTLLSGDRFAA